jgi:putative retron-type reverse transcriptase
MGLTFEKLFEAYLDCRKHKRNTINALMFEYNLEQNLFRLYEDLVSGEYKIGQSICFIVLYPKPREVWAADFRDRIVHHLIYNEIKDKFYKRFIKDTYSCIPDRGTTNAVKSVRAHAESVTHNYTETAYFLKADLKNFFVSIDKNILYDEIQKFVNEEWVLSLIKQVIFHNPKTSVCIKSPAYKFDFLPKYKSLWHTQSDKGLPIGNLTSQFFSNVYLNVLDQYVKHHLKCKYYCRYVDDFVIMHKSPQYLNDVHKDLTVFLKERLNLELHQNKKLINKVDKGIDFVGFVVKPYRINLRQKTIKRIFKIIREQKLNEHWFYEGELETFCSTINSYLGMLRNTNGYRLRKEICLQCINLFVKCDSEFTKLTVVLRSHIEIERNHHLH